MFSLSDRSGCCAAVLQIDTDLLGGLHLELVHGFPGLGHALFHINSPESPTTSGEIVFLCVTIA